MKVLVRAYSIFTEALGESLLEVEVPEGTTVRELVTRLLPGGEYRGIRPHILLNGKPADGDEELRNGDIIYVVPPFSGG